MDILEELKTATGFVDRGLNEKGLELYNKLLKDPQLKEKKYRIACLPGFAEVLWRLHMHNEAEKVANELLVLTKGDPKQLRPYGQAIYTLGMVALKREKYDLTVKYIKESLLIFKKIEDELLEADVLNVLGIVNTYQGNFEPAEHYYRKSLTLYEKHNDQKNIGKITLNLGTIYFTMGMLEQAIAFLEQSITAMKKFQNEGVLGATYITLGRIAVVQGENGIAEEYFNKAIFHLDIFKRQEFMVRVRFNLVKLLTDTERIKEAEFYANEMLEIVMISESLEGRARHNLALSYIELYKFELSSALNHAKTAKKQSLEIPRFDLHVEASFSVLSCLLQLFHLTKRKPYQKEFDDLLIHLESLTKRENLHSQYIEIIHLQGLMRKAELDFLQAIEKFELAELLARERGLRPLAEKANVELLKLRKEVKAFKRFEEVGKKEIDKAQMDDMISYLKEAQKHILPSESRSE